MKFLLLFFAIFIFAQCGNENIVDVDHQKTPSDNKGLANTGIFEDLPDDLAKVEGEYRTENLNDSKLETVLAQPVPSIWLKFNCQNENPANTPCSQENLKVGLPPEAQKLLEVYWNEFLSSHYKYYLRTNEMTASEDLELTKSFAVKAIKFNEDLQKIYVETPYRKRLISTKEADEIEYLVNTFASEIIKKVKDPNLK